MKDTDHKKFPKLDILAFGAHPDDVEAGCAGLLIKAVHGGKKVGIVDLSLAELSSNGTVQLRVKEALRAAKIIGTEVRENLELPNNFFTNGRLVQEKIIEMVRKYRPEIVLLPYHTDRHPDHEETPRLVWPALFTSGLTRFKTNYPAHRPKYVFSYRLWYDFAPSFILDISEEFEKKIKSLLAYKSQFAINGDSVSTKDNEPNFMEYWRARHRNYGYEIGVEYGEPYLSLTPIGLKDMASVLPNYS